ncbi:MAG: thiamine pyrophosphate-dependent enzyme, partial [Flavobacteriales bacterium]
TAEGGFWETFNAAGILQVPMAISVWDDGYGISVPKQYQTTKGDISKVTQGFQRKKNEPGYEIFKVKGWDYVELCKTYEKAIKLCRNEHVPVLIHVDELTQPQGHSTSGSHERYKSKERMEWMKEYECVNQFKKWILSYDNDGQKLSSEEELEQIEKEAKDYVKEEKKAAWKAYRNDIDEELNHSIELLSKLSESSTNGDSIKQVTEELQNTMTPIRMDVMRAIRRGLRYSRGENSEERKNLLNWFDDLEKKNHDRFNTKLYSDSEYSALNVEEVPAEYDDKSEEVDGRVVLRDNFHAIFDKNPKTLVFGEDSGYLGDVNQGLEGMQAKFGEVRVSDTGIREETIVGQGIGLAMRGLRPIAEIQYLDYLMYATQIMSDDLATLQYRTKGGQKSPLIVRTRGHRLEGIWHAGSLMAAYLNSFRGIYICVPRNMTHAAGFYNTLLEGDDPALIVEPLNAYRTKEKLPTNVGEFKIPLGEPEVLREGTDITVVSYGSTFNICIEAAEELEEIGVSVELVDVRTLLPF